MKALSIIFFIYFFYSNNSLGQKVTYKDLIGTWDERYTELHPEIVLKFVDSTHLTSEQKSTKHKLDSLPSIVDNTWEFKYTLNFSSASTVLLWIT